MRDNTLKFVTIMNILRSYSGLVFLLLLAKLAVSQPDKPPFASAVRIEQYANTLEKQRQELRKSALLARFAASREKLSAIATGQPTIL